MVNPSVELKAKKQEFISIRELISRVSAQYPEMTTEQVANWILIKLYEAKPNEPDLLIQDSMGVTRSPNYADPTLSAYDLLSKVMTSPNMDDPPYDGWHPGRTDSFDDIPF